MRKPNDLRRPIMIVSLITAFFGAVFIALLLFLTFKKLMLINYTSYAVLPVCVLALLTTLIVLVMRHKTIFKVPLVVSIVIMIIFSMIFGIAPVLFHGEIISKHVSSSRNNGFVIRKQSSWVFGARPYYAAYPIKYKLFYQLESDGFESSGIMQPGRDSENLTVDVTWVRDTKAFVKMLYNESDETEKITVDFFDP